MDKSSRDARSGGKTVTWPAIAIFRFHDSKIAEEWVSRDELGMLIELGVLANVKN